jgi:hypothetical protein
MCSIDVAAVLKLSPHEFDQGPHGFRALASKPGCDAETADLIALYRRTNWAKLDQGQVAISYWHEGQSRAFAGQRDQAIPLLLAGVNPGVSGVNAEVDAESALYSNAFAQYALATVAFLQNDLPALKRARERLAAIPMPASYAKLDSPSPWPMNLKFVDGFIACFGKTYRQAYAC